MDVYLQGLDSNVRFLLQKYSLGVGYDVCKMVLFQACFHSCKKYECMYFLFLNRVHLILLKNGLLNVRVSV